MAEEAFEGETVVPNKSLILCILIIYIYVGSTGKSSKKINVKETINSHITI